MSAKNQLHFALKPAAMAILTICSSFAFAYSQGKGETATVVKGELVEKFETLKNDNLEEKIIGRFDRAGDPVRIIWYGNPNDADGQKQDSANNAGKIHGKVIGVGVDTTDSKHYAGSLAIDAQGNGIDALGWSAPKNANDINFDVKKVENSGDILAEADLTGGNAETHGAVTAFGSADGISIIGMADFGQNNIQAGAGGLVDGFTGATSVSRSRSTRSVRSAPVETKPATTVAESTPSTSEPTASVEETDMHGKHVIVDLKTVTNSGNVHAHFVGKGSQAITEPNTAEYKPQFYSVSIAASGNAISAATYINTIDKYTFSEEKKNRAALGTINNSGRLLGESELTGGKNTTHTYTRSVSSGNGVSAYARTGSYAKNSTYSEIGDVTNSGQILGKIRQTSGNNSGYESIHMESTASAYASGNGLSSYADAYNGQTKETKTSIGNVTNSGKIMGDTYLKAGNGSGKGLDVFAYGTGNGISTYLYADAVGKGQAEIKNIQNSGIISGNLETHAGITSKSGTIPDTEVKLVITNKNNLSEFSQPDPTPKKPETAASKVCAGSSFFCFPNHTENNYSAKTYAYSSGNGISAYAGNDVLNNRSNLGDINNSGVISGYAKLYHGFVQFKNKYEDVNFLAVGSGIAIDKPMTSNITNTGIVSGNHSALLAKGLIDDAQSVFNPDFVSGIKGKVDNYGLMAGQLINGSYHGTQRNSAQLYKYFEGTQTHRGVQGLENIQNAGTYVRLNSDESINVVEQGKGGIHSINGVTYEVINGLLTNGHKDSEYTATESTLSQKIINGAGVANGALIANKALTLNGSVVNGYKTAVNLQTDQAVAINHTTLNANGFKVNKTEQTNVVLGDGKANDLTLAGSKLNGNLDLKAGDDKLTIKDQAVKFNGNLMDLGEGNDRVIFGEKEANQERTAVDPIKVDYAIANAENLEIASPTVITTTSDIKGVNEISFNSTLIYQVLDATHHALFDSNREGTITLKGDGEFVVDINHIKSKLPSNVNVMDAPKDYVVDFGKLSLSKSDNVVLKTTEAFINAILKDGKLILNFQPETEVGEGVTVEEEPEGIITENGEGVTVEENPEGIITENGEGVTAEENPEGIIDEQGESVAVEEPPKGIITEPNEGVTAEKNPEGVIPEEKSAENATDNSNNVTSKEEPTVSLNTNSQYAAAYQSAKQASGTDSFLKNTEQAGDVKALNDYLAQVVDKNIYAAASTNSLRNLQAYQQQTLAESHLLKQGKVSTQATYINAQGQFKENADKSSLNGVLISARVGLTDTTTIGMNVGTGQSKVEGMQQSQLKGKSVYTSAYLSQGIDQLTLTAGVAYQHNDLKGDRYISNGYDSHHFDAKVKSNSIGIFTQAKYAIPLSETWAFEPKVGVAFHHLKQDNINESGLAGLEIADQSMNITEAVIGQDLTGTYPMTNGALKVKLSTDYVNTSGQKDLKGRFHNSNEFDIHTEKDRNSARLGASVSYQMGGLTFRVGGYNQFRKSGNAWSANAGVGYSF